MDRVNYKIDSFVRLKTVIFYACDYLILSLWVSIVRTNEDGLVSCKNSLSIAVLFWVGTYWQLVFASLHPITTEQVLFLESR